MALYQAICVKARSADGSHDHLSYLGLGTQAGWTRRITVDEAVRQLWSTADDRYYTVSPSTGVRAEARVSAAANGRTCAPPPTAFTTTTLSRLSICQGG